MIYLSVLNLCYLYVQLLLPSTYIGTNIAPCIGIFKGQVKIRIIELWRLDSISISIWVVWFKKIFKCTVYLVIDLDRLKRSRGILKYIVFPNRKWNLLNVNQKHDRTYEPTKRPECSVLSAAVFNSCPW